MVVAGVWNMTGVATAEERSYADDGLATAKSGDEDCECWAECVSLLYVA